MGGTHLVQGGGEVLLRGREQMRVSCCCFYGGVSEAVGDGLRREAQVDEEGRVRMAQVVGG